jgi:hypothetical protein
MRIDCLQCHNDYLGNVQFPTASRAQTTNPEDSLRTGQQSDFHQLAAYFGTIRMDNPFSGLKEEGQAYRTKYLNAQVETDVEASVPFEHQWCGYQTSNRQGLADWVTHPSNRAFARATVNRVWAILAGKPLVQPIDDIPAQGPYPPGLEALADDFIEHGYDLKRLVRVIIATGVYRIDSQWSQGDSSQTEQIDESYEKAWALFPVSQLRPEQMAAAVHQACRLKTIDASSSILSQLSCTVGSTTLPRLMGAEARTSFSSSRSRSRKGS